MAMTQSVPAAAPREASQPRINFPQKQNNPTGRRP
jgi:hypothetical protein